MANLPIEKQVAIIGDLCEGSSIRSIERMTGVHRDTIMRLGVKVGQGCTALIDQTMVNLPCNRLEMDEIWGFVGRKQKNVRVDNAERTGDVWTFCAIDADTKLVPAFKVGKRDNATAHAFVQDVADRMANCVQISTDGLKAYVGAVESAFGDYVDYAQIIKTYGCEEVNNNRRYSAHEFVGCDKRDVTGSPWHGTHDSGYGRRRHSQPMERGGFGGGVGMTHIQELWDVINHLHRATATHLESVPVTETFNGETVWNGVVEGFSLKGHPKTDRVYAWIHATDDPKKPKRHVTVLHVPPVVSPRTAVQAAIVQEFKDAQKH